MVVANTPSALRDPVTTTITSPTNEKWLLQLEPAAGWAPPWRDALLAMVNAISAVIGALLLCVFVNRRQQSWLLAELRVGRRLCMAWA